MVEGLRCVGVCDDLPADGLQGSADPRLELLPSCDAYKGKGRGESQSMVEEGGEGAERVLHS